MTEDTEKKKRSGDSTERYQLRLPDGLLAKIRTSARVNNRTMNSEIVHVLEKSYADQPEDRKISPYISEIRSLLSRMEKISLFDEIRAEVTDDPGAAFTLRSKIGVEEYKKFREYQKIQREILDRYAAREYDRIVNYGDVEEHIYEEIKRRD